MCKKNGRRHGSQIRANNKRRNVVPLRRRNIYYVDYENVRLGGLDGINLLTDQDLVVVLHSGSFGAVERRQFDHYLRRTKAKVEYFETPTGDQALDKCLFALLYNAVNEHGEDFGYHLVARDKGYIAVVQWMLEHKPGARILIQVQDCIGDNYSEIYHHCHCSSNSSVLRDVGRESVEVLDRLLSEHNMPKYRRDLAVKKFCEEYDKHLNVKQGFNSALQVVVDGAKIKGYLDEVKVDMNVFAERVRVATAHLACKPVVVAPKWKDDDSYNCGLEPITPIMKLTGKECKEVNMHFIAELSPLSWKIAFDYIDSFWDFFNRRKGLLASIYSALDQNGDNPKLRGAAKKTLALKLYVRIKPIVAGAIPLSGLQRA